MARWRACIIVGSLADGADIGVGGDPARLTPAVVCPSGPGTGAASARFAISGESLPCPLSAHNGRGVGDADLEAVADTIECGDRKLLRDEKLGGRAPDAARRSSDDRDPLSHTTISARGSAGQ
jgi:hypothetical protein